MINRSSISLSREVISIFFLLVMLLLSGLGTTLPIPHLVNIQEDFNYPSGFIEAAYVMVSIISLVVWGYLSDTTNRRLLLVISNVIWITSSITIAFSTTLVIYFIFRLMMAMGLAALSPLAYSILADSATREHRALVSAGLNLSWVGSSALGIIVGSLFSSWRESFGFIGICGLLLLIIIKYIPLPKRAHSEPAFMELDSYEYKWKFDIKEIPELVERKSLWFLLSQGTFALIPGTVYTYWLVSYLSSPDEGLGLSLAIASFFAIIIASGRAFGYLFFGAISDLLIRKNYSLNYRSILATICMIGQAPFFLLAFIIEVNSQALVLFAISFWLGSFIGAASGPNRSALMFAVTLPENRGTVGSLFSLTDQIGQVIGLFISTIMIAQYGFRTTFIENTFFYVIAAILWFPTIFLVKKESELSQEILEERAKEIKLEK